jgi:glycosyltransferase involved in cell wall biosynthesis
VYAGKLNRLHDPANFFIGLRRLLDTGVPEQSIAFVYLGPHDAKMLALADKHGIQKSVVALGRVPVPEARLLMARSNLLLLLSPANGQSGIPGGKLYEYLAAGPPIIAVPDTDSFVMGILRETHAGEGASTPDEVADALLRHFMAWRSGSVASRPLRELDGFSWSARAERLSTLLGERVSSLGGVA